MRDLTRRQLLGAAGLVGAGLVASCGRTPPGADTPLPRNAFTDLQQRLRGTVILPGDSAYAQLATPRNLRFAATMPKAVVQCAEEEDVAATVKWARKTNTPFAIRGGGHNYADASASTGIVISTSLMKSASLDGTTMWAQAGVRNVEVGKLLPRRGSGRLLLPGGNCPGVGLVGLTLGGGIGPNAPWAGLTADRLRKVTMVNAVGDLVTVSATESPDMFWGLRGGAGGNFGVVTELQYELVEVPVLRATTAELTVTGRDAAVAAAAAFQKLRAEFDRVVTGNLSLGSTPAGVEAELTAQLFTGEADARGILAPLLAMPDVRGEVTERWWWDAYGWYITPPKPNYSFWDRSLYTDDFLPDDALAAIVDVVGRFPGVDHPDRNGGATLFGWVGGAVNDVAPDATAYVHRKAKVLVEMRSGWSAPAAQPAPTGSPASIPPDIRDWMVQLWESVLPHTSGRCYQNFQDPELPDWANAYYGDNLARLVGLKAEWDPDGVFDHDQGIPRPR